MKRESSRYQWVGIPGWFVRPITEHRSVLALLSLARTQGGLHARKVFVIKQRGRLDSRTGAGKTIQRILIFDDHPDSLRLVLGRSPTPQPDQIAPPSARWWEPVLGGMLITAALIALFLPLFLKLPS
jgi:hypothetical protein